MTDPRDRIIGYLHDQLIGPLGGDQEFLREDPSRRYLAGILFPQQAEANEAFSDDVIDDETGQIGQEVEDDPMVLANQRMPSSAGISFVLTETDRIAVAIEAGIYRKGTTADDLAGEISGWQRETLNETVMLTLDGPSRIDVFGGAASLRAVWRPNPNGHLVTIAVVNEATGSPATTGLYQVAMTCTPSQGWISGYPTSGVFFRDDEEEEHALIHRSRPVFAVGHGTSATWKSHGAQATEVSITFMPEETVPDTDFALTGFEELLSLQKLAHPENDQPWLLAQLDSFVTAYQAWSKSFADQAVPPGLASAKQRILDRQTVAVGRMRKGIDVLRTSQEARDVFGLANRAMLMQMTHSRGKLGPHRKKRNHFDYETPDYSSQDFAWRPFQLAFILLNLEAIMDADSPDRDTVDLIWFPTGGGKTEAYLALVAMTVLLRRWRLGNLGAGTAVITRYTLRLLTSQQFQRAAALICALELIRRQDRADADRYTFGDAPITIGLWVGGGSSPNRYSDAEELREQLLDKSEDGAVGFQVELCPWCGTEVVPPRSRRSEQSLGISADNESFRIWCPTSSCPFHERLPLSSVDDDLYDNPPSVLIATVDKFARFAWEPRAGVFLGTGSTPGPDLIIQDELHLISGPLGTIMGLYESAFDHVMSKGGARPKTIASTATIRNADAHVKGLFNRRVFLFPPSGLDADDSYFVRLDRSSSGRRYLGLMAQSHTPTTATVRVAAGLLQAPMELSFDDHTADRFWTLVAYHNSLRELGKTVTLAKDDIPSWINITASLSDNERPLDRDEHVIELTSNIPAASIPRELEKLARPLSSGEAVSMVACTNMISVGVDVPRLGLMLVVGQPKTTSEYIQATSRIGRTEPGLVVTLLSSAKSRDRSHFESFRGFHQAMYRNVEPGSVTPFALPARRRALHAALVILMRHSMGLSALEDADRFDPTDPTTREAMDWLIARAAAVDPLERDDTERHLGQLAQEWARLTNDPQTLRYWSRARQIPSLLKRFGQPGSGWSTLDSMRDVDVETLIKVRGELRTR